MIAGRCTLFSIFSSSSNRCRPGGIRRLPARREPRWRGRSDGENRWVISIRCRTGETQPPRQAGRPGRDGNFRTTRENRPGVAQLQRCHGTWSALRAAALAPAISQVCGTPVDWYALRRMSAVRTVCAPRRWPVTSCTPDGSRPQCGRPSAPCSVVTVIPLQHWAAVPRVAMTAKPPSGNGARSMAAIAAVAVADRRENGSAIRQFHPSASWLSPNARSASRSTPSPRRSISSPDPGWCPH